MTTDFDPNAIDRRVDDLLARSAAAVPVRPDLAAVVEEADGPGVVVRLTEPPRRTRRRLAVAAAVLVVLGVLGVAIAAARDDVTRQVAEGRAASPLDAVDGPGLEDHWHVAYAFQVCGKLLPPVEDRGPDTYGIHTHGDGLIHIHPFLAASAGAEARLGRFLDQVGATLDGDRAELTIGGTVYGCDADAVVRVARWSSAAAAAEGAAPDSVVVEDVGDIVLGPDGGALTIAVGPADELIAAPPSAADLCALGAVDGATGVCADDDEVATPPPVTAVPVAPPTTGGPTASTEAAPPSGGSTSEPAPTGGDGEGDGAPMDAEAAIDAAFHTAFDTGIPDEERFAAVEDGPELLEAGREAVANYPQAADSISITVHSIDVVAPDRATVVFELFYQEAQLLGPQTGEAVLVEGQWKVSRETRCALIRQAGVDCR